MTATPLYHIGVLVNDMTAAIEHFGAQLGLTFNEPRVIHLDQGDLRVRLPSAEAVGHGDRPVRSAGFLYPLGPDAQG